MKCYVNEAGTKVLAVVESSIGAPSVTLIVSITDADEELRLSPKAFILPMGYKECDLEPDSMLVVTKAAARLMLNGLGLIRFSEDSAEIVREEVRLASARSRIRKDVAKLDDPETLKFLDDVKRGKIKTLDDIDSPDSNRLAKSVGDVFGKKNFDEDVM